HPALPIGADTWTYPGSIEVRPDTIRRVVEDIGVSLGRQGFRRIILANNHGGPSHNLALEAAARGIARRSPARALSRAARDRVSSLREEGLHPSLDRHGLRKDDVRYDFHAGAFETSEMLALFPDKVRDGWQRLAPVMVPWGRMRKDSALRAGDGLGY